MQKKRIPKECAKIDLLSMNATCILEFEMRGSHWPVQAVRALAHLAKRACNAQRGLCMISNESSYRLDRRFSISQFSISKFAISQLAISSLFASLLLASLLETDDV